MSNPVRQHDVPKTYLKWFTIDPSSNKWKSMVYCFWKNQQTSQVKPISIKSTKFKTNDLYTVVSDDPYIFEQFFRENVEPFYNPIMYEINEEKDLSQGIREELVLWLYFNKMRNRATRSHFENLAEFSIKADFHFRNVQETYDENIGRKFAQSMAKKTQLESLIDEKVLNSFISCVENKYWTILRSHKDNVFITNDNPGFSIKQNREEVDYSSLDKNLRTNDDLLYYFILSPKYCLLISPFLKGEQFIHPLYNQKIEYVILNDTHIDLINSCTAITRTKYLISNDKKQIERFKQMSESSNEESLYNQIQKAYSNEY